MSDARTCPNDKEPCPTPEQCARHGCARLAPWPRPAASSAVRPQSLAREAYESAWRIKESLR
jgi:hypothetical protein